MKIEKTPGKKNKTWRRKGKQVPKFDELIFRFPMYSGYEVTVIVGPNISACGYYVSDRDYVVEPSLPNGEDGTRAFCVHLKRDAHSYMFIRPDAPASTIAHESWHVAYAITEFIGAKVENEFIAYLIGYIVDAVVSFQKKMAPHYTKFLASTGVKSSKTEGHNVDHRPSSKKRLPSRSGRRRGSKQRPHKKG